MNFVKRMNSVLDYIEENLDGEINDDKIAVLSVNSKGMFQRIFTMITDMPLSEYIRKRKLTQAADDIQNTEAKIIDIAVKYGYNSADAFTSAFKNFHGITPSGAKNPDAELQSFRRFTFNPNLTITGGNNNMQYRNISLDETLYFWSRSDYLIIQNLLLGKMKHLWRGAERANINSKGMLMEFERGERTLEEIEIVRYKNRAYEKLDGEAKENILKIAKIDIFNILTAMKPAKKEMLLYSTIWYADLLANYTVPNYEVGDIVEFKNISETCITPYEEDIEERNPQNCASSLLDIFEKDPENANVFYRYEITVPEGGYILELDEHEEHSKDWGANGEALLPPMKCRVKNIRTSDNKRCRGIIEFEYLEKLPDPIFP